MTNLNPGGGDVPTSFTFVDIKVPTFTIAQGATGGTYVVTNSTKTLTINSAISGGSGLFSADGGAKIIDGWIYGKQSGNSTDTYDMILQKSVDDGGSYSTVGSITNLGGANNGKVFGSDFGATTIDLPFTSGNLKFRLVLTDGTDPTTDAFTLTNIRCTLLVMYSK